MNSEHKFLVLILIGSLFYSIGDVLLKLTDFSQLINVNDQYNWLILVIFISALGLTFISKILIGKVLSSSELGYTQAIFIAISIVLTASFGVVFFKEVMDFQKIIGLLLLVIGTVIIIRDGNDLDL